MDDRALSVQSVLWPAMAVVCPAIFAEPTPVRLLQTGEVARLTPGPLAQAVMAGACPTVEDLVVAATVEVGITFGVRVDALRILDATRSMVVAGFRATALARPAGDPVWPLWTRDALIAVPGCSVYNGLDYLTRGVESMVQGRFRDAIALLRSVTEYLRLRDPRENFLLGKIVAANIALAVSEAETAGLRMHRS